MDASSEATQSHIELYEHESSEHHRRRRKQNIAKNNLPAGKKEGYVAGNHTNIYCSHELTAGKSSLAALYFLPLLVS